MLLMRSCGISWIMTLRATNGLAMQEISFVWCAIRHCGIPTLRNLRSAHISNKRIVIHAHRTDLGLSILLNDAALKILAKYEDLETKDGHAFDVPSSQKLNKAIQDAVKKAELDRKVLDGIKSAMIKWPRTFFLRHHLMLCSPWGR